MKNKAARVKLMIKNKDVEKDFKRIINSVEGLRVDEDQQSDTFDLIIFELGEGAHDELQIIKSLFSSGAYGEVFLTASDFDADLLVHAMRIGAKEFFGQPLKEEEVRESLLSFQERKKNLAMRDSVRYGQIIYTMGTKGGAGTTTIAVNLATTMAENDKTRSVALIDINKVFGDIPLFLSLKPHFDWNEILRDISRVDETLLMNILTRHKSGVFVLSSPGLISEGDEFNPGFIEHILNIMLKMFDFIIIDGGHSLDGTAMKILEKADIVLLIMILSLPYLSNTHKLLESFELLGYPSSKQIKIVASRYLKDGDITLKDAKEALSHDVYWTVPNDYKATMSAINQGKPLSNIAHRAPIVKSFKDLSDTLLNDEIIKKSETRKSSNLLSLI